MNDERPWPQRAEDWLRICGYAEAEDTVTYQAHLRQFLVLRKYHQSRHFNDEWIMQEMAAPAASMKQQDSKAVLIHLVRACREVVA